MTDEQRKQFEKWAEGIDMAPDFAAEREKCPDDPTHGWNYGKLTAWEAWQARDAEVQALREALEHADALMLKAAHTLAKQHADADAADPLLEAVQQIRNTIAGRNTP